MTDFVSDLYEALADGCLVRPEADQAPCCAVTDALRRCADSIRDDAGEANRHVQRLLSSGRGEAMDALGQHWDRDMNQDVAPVAEAARTTGTTAYDIGDVVAVTKTQITQIAAACAEETAAALVAGAGGTGAEGISVDHAEHERAADRLREVATQVHGGTAGLLSEAAREHAAAAASGVLGAAVAGALDPVLGDLAACTTAFGDHLNGALPDGILLISGSRRAMDGDSRRRMSELDR
ncbi:hypothetical protein [Streptomyces sp. NPDC093089]|uniref:hypothetical protein n=1 Tax=Streptomyces sp. NPDC093089 TaxID=3366024 RepID=UPI0038163491